MPSSFISSSGLNRESIISTFGDWVRTDALYRDISGQYLEPTTWHEASMIISVTLKKYYKTSNGLGKEIVKLLVHFDNKMFQKVMDAPL
jgi:hypothetical protein